MQKAQLSRLEEDAERLTRRVEAQLNELNQGYTRLQELALTAPLGVAGAAAKYQSRLASDIGPAVGAWDSERHREILFESREVKRQIDVKSSMLFSLDRNRNTTASVRRKEQHRKNKTQRQDLDERDLADYPVALRRYCGGFHGESSPKKPQAEKQQPENESSQKAKPASSKQSKIKHTKKSLAAVNNTRHIVKPTIIVKDDATARAAVDYAKSALNEAVVATRRAAQAANKAADRANAATPPKMHSPYIDDDDPPEYRVMVPSKYSDPFLTVLPETNTEEDLRPEDINFDDKPQVERIDGRVLLARPTAMNDAMPTLPRPRVQCAETNHALEAERLRAVAEASPLYIAQGSAPPKKPKSHRIQTATFTNSNTLSSNVPSYGQQEDCINLVARLLLAKNNVPSDQATNMQQSQQRPTVPPASPHGQIHSTTGTDGEESEFY